MSDETKTQAGGNEPRTVRELREAIHDVEAAIARLEMAPALAGQYGIAYKIESARLAVREAERRLAKADDPRLPALASFRPQLRDPRPRHPNAARRRRRYRCPRCFEEELVSPDYAGNCYLCRRDGVMVTLQPIRRGGKRVSSGGNDRREGADRG